MFSGITGSYDLINHVFTWGMDRRWRDKLVAECLKLNPEKVLDIGCGTGDQYCPLCQGEATCYRL
jgi:demethylmenaquinone methyltransferase/2-methoxy-6-polyprenyl-1,4-benzoquinol methylase